jgi:hypothetical protein
MSALAVMAGIILLASGCGGSPSSSSDASSSSSPGASSSPGTSNAAKEVAFVDCMRAHGVDVSVGSNGQISSNGGGGSGGPQAAQSAQNACRHLLPNGGQPSQAQQAKALQQALKYTQCMRSHGVPKFPDPNPPANGGPVGFSITPNSGVDPRSATYQKANQACQSVEPGAGSGPGSGSGG